MRARCNDVQHASPGHGHSRPSAPGLAPVIQKIPQGKGSWEMRGWGWGEDEEDRIFLGSMEKGVERRRFFWKEKGGEKLFPGRTIVQPALCNLLATLGAAERLFAQVVLVQVRCLWMSWQSNEMKPSCSAKVPICEPRMRRKAAKKKAQSRAKRPQKRSEFVASPLNDCYDASEMVYEVALLD